MYDILLYNKLSKLPENLKSEVPEFIGSLVAKEKKTSEKKKPIFGSGKGIFVTHDDFDEPLEDFKAF
jgi:Protein of unknown function (DUF2281)